MDRCVIMVDAGYVYAAGGRLCCGTPSRGEIVLDAGAFIGALTSKVGLGLGRQVLRTYWYDAARDGIRTEEQQAIAGLYDVKLRLGRLNGYNQQKGVDALSYRWSAATRTCTRASAPSRTMASGSSSSVSKRSMVPTSPAN